MTRVVLGSASAGRLKVLRQAGIDPLVVVSGVDEEAVVAQLGPHAAPTTVTTALATAKADRVVAGLDSDVAADCVVIGCDSMLYCNDTLIGKPASIAEARSLWQSMAGCAGQLFTGHCVIRLRDNNITHRAADVAITTVHFGDPSPDDLDAYLATRESLQTAGGFTIDGLSGWFIEGVDGDPSAVVGIGLPLTRSLLHRAGLTIAALWAANPVT